MTYPLHSSSSVFCFFLLHVISLYPFVYGMAFIFESRLENASNFYTFLFVLAVIFESFNWALNFLMDPFSTLWIVSLLSLFLIWGLYSLKYSYLLTKGMKIDFPERKFEITQIHPLPSLTFSIQTFLRQFSLSNFKSLFLKFSNSLPFPPSFQGRPSFFTSTTSETYIHEHHETEVSYDPTHQDATDGSVLTCIYINSMVVLLILPFFDIFLFHSGFGVWILASSLLLIPFQ